MTTARLYAIWAAIGPLVGVIIGAWLSEHWQHRRWILDNKTAEYRGILDALTACHIQLLAFIGICTYAPAKLTLQREALIASEQRALAEKAVSLSQAMADRLFIRKALAKRGVRQEFGNLALDNFLDALCAMPDGSSAPADSTGLTRARITQVAEALETLHKTIAEIADEDLGLK